MPHINSLGSVCHGVSGGHVNIDNVPHFIGGVGGWVDDTHVACSSGEPGDVLPGDQWPAMIYTVGGARVAASTPPTGANLAFAGGGHMAWFWSTPGGFLYSTTGFRNAAAGLLGMGPDASIAYKPNYHATGPTRVREIGGGDYLLTPNHAYGLQLLGGRRAIWVDSVLGLKTIGLPTPSVYPGEVVFPYAFLVGGVWWIGYYSGAHGTLMHPFSAPNLDHVLVPLGVNAWPAWRAMSNNSVRFAWSSGEGEQAGDITATTITIAGVPPGPVAPLPPTTGPAPPETPPPVSDVRVPRAKVAVRQPLSRQYPHVEAISDWRAQQTTRLLWDRVFDLEERLQSTEKTAGDLVEISNSQDDHLVTVQRASGEALALAQAAVGAGEGGALGPNTMPNYSAIVSSVLATKFVQPPVVPSALEEQGKAQLTRVVAWEVYQTDPRIRLLAKTAGTQVNNRSVDIILLDVDGSAADVNTAVNNGDGTHTIKAAWSPVGPDANTTDTTRHIVPSAAIAAESGPLTPI